MTEPTMPRTDREMVLHQASQMLRLLKELAPGICPDFCPDMQVLHQHLSGHGSSEVDGTSYEMHIRGQRNIDETWSCDVLCLDPIDLETIGFFKVSYNDQPTWMLEYTQQRPEMPVERMIYSISDDEAKALLFE